MTTDDSHLAPLAASPVPTLTYDDCRLDSPMYLAAKRHRMRGWDSLAQPMQPGRSTPSCMNLAAKRLRYALPSAPTHLAPLCTPLSQTLFPCALPYAIRPPWPLRPGSTPPCTWQQSAGCPTERSTRTLGPDREGRVAGSACAPPGSMPACMDQGRETLIMHGYLAVACMGPPLMPAAWLLSYASSTAVLAKRMHG